jgi:hypothetical protein
MPPRKSKGIFGGDTNPDIDADVIMTAAVVGYSNKRLEEKKNCAFAAEVEHDFPILPKLTLPQTILNYKKWVENCDPIVKEYLSEIALFQSQVKDMAKLKTIAEEDVAFSKGWILLDNAIDRINFALGIDITKDGPKVVVDATPNYGGTGVIWIVGGTGDLDLYNENRYVNSPIRNPHCGQRIYEIKGSGFRGYKGPGAYTGMSSRQNGESYIYSTFRGYPSAKAGKRWLPEYPEILGYAIKPGKDPDGKLKYISIWGIIGTNEIAEKTQYQYQMVYEDFAQNDRVSDYQPFVVGYTHGMIQAIYDVVQFELNAKKKSELYSGVPYEIGLVGKKANDPSTTKMASCFYCSLFMEANEKPASSIHLGSGESWAPTYYSHDLIEANLRINDDPDKSPKTNFRNLEFRESIDRCNSRWEDLCLEVLLRGANAIQKNMLEPDHIDSFTALGTYLNGLDQQDAANLILDSATVHEKIVVRVVRTLKPPQ